MAVFEVTITPLGTGNAGVSSFVAGCLQILKASGLKYQLTPMGTIIEGEMDEVFGFIRKMHESPFAAGAVRVVTLLRIDDRRDKKEHTMASKLQSVEKKL
jgi:uncharacterized protein (TIGR00106 family)